jgi:hypothetical protein
MNKVNKFSTLAAFAVFASRVGAVVREISRTGKLVRVGAFVDGVLVATAAGFVTN